MSEASLTAAGLLLLGGCAQLAGIEETSGDGLIGVSLSFERVSIGSTVIKAPLDLSNHTAEYLIADELEPGGFSRVVAEQTELGRWTAGIFDATPPVLFDLPEAPGQFQRLWSFPNRDLFGGLEFLEHPAPAPLTDLPTPMLTVNVTLDVGFTTDTYELFIVGAWNQIALPAPAMGLTALAPPPFAASTMNSLTGRPLEQFTRDDTILVIRRLGANARLSGLLEVTPFDQTGNDMLSGTMLGVAPDKTLGLEINPAAAMGRLDTLPSSTASSFGWEVRAAPGHEAGNGSGPLLVFGTALMTDTAVNVMYGNPFADRGWAPVLGWSATGSRTAIPAGQTLQATLFAGLFQGVLDPPAGSVLDFPAGVTTLITFDDIPLMTDTETVPAPVDPVVITISNELNNGTLYVLDVFELVPDAGGMALDRRLVLDVIGLEPRFVIPPDVFEVGKVYTLRATTVVDGFPSVADGDLRTKTFPISTSFLDSGAFLVTP